MIDVIQGLDLVVFVNIMDVLLYYQKCNAKQIFHQHHFVKNAIQAKEYILQ